MRGLTYRSAYTSAGVRFETKENKINEGYTVNELRALIFAHRHKLSAW